MEKLKQLPIWLCWKQEPDQQGRLTKRTKMKKGRDCMDTIKQLIPISDDVSAMISLGDKNQEVLQDAREIGFQVFLALVEDEDRDSTVIPYVIDPYGFGGLDWVVDFVPVRRCPKCGEKMLVRMKDEASDPEYYCRCE